VCSIKGKVLTVNPDAAPSFGEKKNCVVLQAVTDAEFDKDAAIN
jgi:hypothetical protein